MKTAELSGAALDWAVAKCEGFNIDIHSGMALTIRGDGDWWNPSIDWAQGGPIIEREGIALYLYGNSEWNAMVCDREIQGPTLLIAAMRCYVASELGDDIEIPEDLT